MSSTHTARMVLTAQRLALSGYSKRRIAKKLGISKNTVSRWVDTLVACSEGSRRAFRAETRSLYLEKAIKAIAVDNSEIFDKLNCKLVSYGGELEGAHFATNANDEQLKYAATVIATSSKPVKQAFDRDGLLYSYFCGLVDSNSNGVFDNMSADEKEAWMQGWCDFVLHLWKFREEMTAPA